MVNAWSLAASILSGTFDKDYPMKKDKDKELDDSGITIENIDGVKSEYSETYEKYKMEYY